MQRKTVILAVVTSCAAIGVVTWLLLRGQAGIQYRTATVEHGDITVRRFQHQGRQGPVDRADQSGGLQARVDQGKANLDAAQAGVANAEAGVQRAKAGIQAANASVGAAGANVVKTQVAVQDAKVKAGRRAQLAKEGVLSKEDVDTAQATYDTAAADRDAIVAQQSAAEDNVKVAQAELKVATFNWRPTRHK
jgi:multidrug resistance efflux pump